MTRPDNDHRTAATWRRKIKIAASLARPLDPLVPPSL